MVVLPPDLIIFNTELSTQFLPPPPSSDWPDLLTTKARLYRENERLEKLSRGNHLYSRERNCISHRYRYYVVCNKRIIVRTKESLSYPIIPQLKQVFSIKLCLHISSSAGTEYEPSLGVRLGENVSVFVGMLGEET